jgi:hypothetical protein
MGLMCKIRKFRLYKSPIFFSWPVVFKLKSWGEILEFSFKFLPNSLKKKREKLGVIREFHISLGFKKGWLRVIELFCRDKKNQKLGFREKKKRTWSFLAFHLWNIFLLRKQTYSMWLIALISCIDEEMQLFILCKIRELCCRLL